MTTPETHPADDPAPGLAARRPAWRRWGLALLLVLAVVGFYVSGLNHFLSWESIRVHLDAWQGQTREHFVLALLVFFALYVAITALSLPVAALLTLVGGALFGRWAATAVVSAASTLGATLAFLTSRYLFRDAVRRRFGDRLGPVDRGVARDGGYYLFTLRLIPAVPFFLINLGMGLTPIRLGTFVAVSWAGMLPGTFLYANAGTELASLDRPEGLLSAPVLGSLALLGLAPLGFRLLLRGRAR
jgi:uncharacterized membrane protein YdjX (TVP38/TMEM64 family)